MSRTSLRVGPNYSGYLGLFQSFADALKLFSKETFSPYLSNRTFFIASPLIGLVIVLLVWVLTPFWGFSFLSFGVFLFVCITGAAVYPLLRSGWSSNCKYSILGRLRGVAQIISYEISLVTILLSICFLVGSFSIISIIVYQLFIYNFYVIVGVGFVFFVSLLAETNRTPYDFSEGESELVSGFNTEYGSGGFTLIFISEYASIIFISCLFRIFFFGGGSYVLKGCGFMIFFIWVRSTLPRYRYDKLINLAWKVFLPISLCFLVFFMGLRYQGIR